MRAIHVLSALALMLAVVWPHYHLDESAASDSDQWCRACQIVDGLSATPPAVVLPQTSAVRVTFYVPYHDAPPRAFPIIRVASPRAPPAFA